MDDFDLARALGHNAHRFSIEWSRIEPQQGAWDEAALDHYVQVVRALRAREIEPLVTLHHFTCPAWFQERGGWERDDSVGLFERFAKHVLERLAPDVRFWITINEPTVYVKRAYVAGSWPPHRRTALWRGCKVLRNLLRAHRAAYRIAHLNRHDAWVGFAHSAPYIAPHDPARMLDRFAAATRRFVLNHLCLKLMARWGRLPLDFIGLNYYARELVRWEPRGLAWLVGNEPATTLDGAARRYNSLGWEMFPIGLTAVLREFSRYGLPLMITENGIATEDEAQRTEYLETHLQALAVAIDIGVDVRGYCYWSLLDNFEWAEGFSARFGLVGVDFATQRRTARPAAHAFKQVCQSNAVQTRRD
jgi:beta-glucosidase